MKILEIKDIQCDEVPLYYRRKYKGCAVIEIPLRVVETPIDFIIETGPTGKQDIQVMLQGAIEYPLLPVLKSLKSFVISMDKEGQLPCC